MIDYVAQVLALCALYGAAATVVAYLSDQAKILQLCSAGLMGVGAYVVALLTTKAGWPTLAAQLITLPIGILAGALLHLLTCRLSGDTLALGTLACAIVIYGVIHNWQSLTEGTMGISAIPSVPPFLGSKAVDFGILALLFVFAVRAVSRSTFGERVRAIGEDQDLADALRLGSLSTRFLLWCGSSAVLAFLGGLYASHARFVDPESFVLQESILLLAMATVFRVRFEWRGLLGALLFVGLPAALRFVGVPPATGAHLKLLMFAVALMVVAAREIQSRTPILKGKRHA